MGFTASSLYTDDGISDYWRLCDVFSLKQTALLILGIDPDSEAGSYCEQWKPHERPVGYGAAVQALAFNLRAGVIKGKNIQLNEWDGYDINNGGEPGIPDTTDINRSSINRDSVADWLKSRGVRTGFFLSNVSSDAPDYLDPSNPRYAPKLAAAVKAWQAVTDPKGKSVKQALEKWLRENAVDFGLTNNDGNPVNQAMTECSAVANWQPSGAPKTPGPA